MLLKETSKKKKEKMIRFFSVDPINDSEIERRGAEQTEQGAARNRNVAGRKAAVKGKDVRKRGGKKKQTFSGC